LTSPSAKSQKLFFISRGNSVFRGKSLPKDIFREGKGNKKIEPKLPLLQPPSRRHFCTASTFYLKTLSSGEPVWLSGKVME
jgi:hypothetical protein